MPDTVLPWPDPDWAHPQPYDGPTPEQVRAMGTLRELSLRLPEWLAAAALGQLEPRRWRELWAVLTRMLDVASEQDTDDITTYTPPAITIHPHHGSIDIDGTLCARCGLPLADDIHAPGPPSTSTHEARHRRRLES